MRFFCCFCPPVSWRVSGISRRTRHFLLLLYRQICLQQHENMRCTIDAGSYNYVFIFMLYVYKIPRVSVHEHCGLPSEDYTAELDSAARILSICQQDTRRLLAMREVPIELPSSRRRSSLLSNALSLLRMAVCAVLASFNGYEREVLDELKRIAMEEHCLILDPKADNFGIVSGQLRLIDWGMACYLSDSQPRHVNEVGTTYYRANLSHEQCAPVSPFLAVYRQLIVRFLQCQPVTMSDVEMACR